jgi:hypothetical protein
MLISLFINELNWIIINLFPSYLRHIFILYLKNIIIFKKKKVKMLLRLFQLASLTSTPQEIAFWLRFTFPFLFIIFCFLYLPSVINKKIMKSETTL